MKSLLKWYLPAYVKMPTEVSIQDYSEKSFVVRGEGTRELRESLRALGGKWNNSLTDKNTGERFGGWIFWSDKRSDVQDRFDGGCNPVAPSFASPVVHLHPS